MWLKRLGGEADAAVEPLFKKYQEALELAFSIKEEEELEPEEEAEEINPDQSGYDDLIGKTIIITTVNLRLKITQDVWDSVRVVQTSWRKFVKRTRSTRVSKLSSERLRTRIASIDSLIPVDDVPVWFYFAMTPGNGSFRPLIPRP